MAAMACVLPVEQKRTSSAVSLPGLVGGYFALRVCITFLFFQSDPKTGTIVSIALNLLLLIPVAVCAIGPASPHFKLAAYPWPVRLVLTFLALALLSLLWSATSSVAVALGYWSALAADVAMVLLLSRADGGQLACESLFKGFVVGACLLCLVAWMAPAMEDLRLGNDDFLSPNVIGFECCFGLLICQCFLADRARWKWFAAFLGITLLRSLSKTSILSFFLLEAIYLLRTGTTSRATKLWIAGGSLIVIAAFSGLFFSYYAVYANAGNQAETLTGRTTIWFIALNLALETPWLGHGFHSFHDVFPLVGTYQAWHAHNELLQQFFVYGLVGVGLVAALYSTLFVQLRRHPHDPLARMGRMLLLLVAIRSFVETDRFDLSFPLWAITTISLALAQRTGHKALEVAQ